MLCNDRCVELLNDSVACATVKRLSIAQFYYLSVTTYRCECQTAALLSECRNRVKCTWILDRLSRHSDTTNKLQNNQYK